MTFSSVEGRDIIWLTRPRSKPVARGIIAAVAASEGLSPADLTGRSCVARITHARHLAMWRVRQETALSYPQIGAIFNRDHSTVISGARAHAKRQAQAVQG